MRVSVWRGGADGAFQSFEVSRQPSQTVLDVVTHIQRHLDPTLAYRYACRVGMCGSCAMTVNGAPRWTCRTPEVKKKFQYMFDRYQAVVEAHKTSDLRDSQPTKGNIAGGLTTIEEKALGNIQKIGRKCVVDGVLDKHEEPTGPGLWFIDSSSAAAEMVTLCAAAGYTVHFFPTGQGNVIGNPILPVIKLCANPRTVRTMSEHIDVDVSGLLRKEMSPDQAGDRLLECMFRTANGRLTAAEALGHREFVLTRLYESA